MQVALDREIFSDPYGSCDNGGPIQNHLPDSPKGTIVGMSIWGGDRLDSIQVGYTKNGAPDGGDSTGKMGGPGGSNLPPRGGRFPVDADDPIVKVVCRSGDVVSGVRFRFASGKSTRGFGGMNGGDDYDVSFDDHYLCRVHVGGRSVFYGQCIECLVFGFKLRATKSVGRMVQQRFFVTSPTQVTSQTFGAKLGLGEANLLHLEPGDEKSLIAKRLQFATKLAQWSVKTALLPER